MSVTCFKQKNDLFSEVKLTCDKIREWSKLEKLPHPCPAPAGETERQFTITIPSVHPAVKAVGSVSITLIKIGNFLATSWSVAF